MSKIVGIDTGGTFTDLVVIDEEGEIEVTKSPSNPEAPVKAFEEVVDKSGVPFPEVSRLIYGTTVAANAVVQREGANVIFITSAGFEDIPFIQRMNRKEAYNLQWLKPKPLVKRRNCLGVAERIDASGKVIVPLTEKTLDTLYERIGARCRSEPIDAIAVHLLFSYINSKHELEIGSFLRGRFPNMPISLSHEVAPIWREYERSSTVIADAFVKPLLSECSTQLLDLTRKNKIGGSCFLLKSNGGMSLLKNAVKRPVQFVLSGLAGGVIGGKYFAESASFENAITFDMGGTSCDVGVVTDGQQSITTEFEIEWGLPIAIPTIDVQTLGAGGGSVAWVDQGGMLNVGPRSAGAVPGPACYGRGNTEPTVTDANLILGRLNPHYFLGGEIPLMPKLAEEAVGHLAERMGIDLLETGSSIVEITNENMTNAIRVMTMGRGLDPQKYVLVAFGGAGPLHACAVARKLGIKKILIPPHSGLCSAFGAALSDLRVERVHTVAGRSNKTTNGIVKGRFETLAKEAEDELRAEAFEGALRKTYLVSMRYHGQNYEEDIEYDPRKGLKAAFEAFHQLHHELYGYHLSEEVIELVHLKALVSEIVRAKPSIRMSSSAATLQQQDAREVYERGGKTRLYAIYRRKNLPPETKLLGPLIVEEMDSTILVPCDARMWVDGRLNIIIELESARG